MCRFQLQIDFDLWWTNTIKISSHFTCCQGNFGCYGGLLRWRFSLHFLKVNLSEVAEKRFSLLQNDAFQHNNPHKSDSYVGQTFWCAYNNCIQMIDNITTFLTCFQSTAFESWKCLFEKTIKNHFHFKSI